MKTLADANLAENEPYNKVLHWFFSFPDASVGLNELCKKVNISKTNANRIIKKFEKEGFLTKLVVGRSWIIKTNKRHYFNRTKKIAFWLNMIYDSNIIFEVHKKFPNAQAIILFGSYRKGDDIEKSDIDIAVNIIGNDKLKIEELGIIKKFGYRQNVGVNLHIFSSRNINQNLFSNIANGIVLDGFLEVKQ